MPKYFTKNLAVKQYDGTTKYLKFRGHTEEEAEAKYQEAKIKLQLGLLTINANTTFARWAEEWKKTYAQPTKSEADFKQFSSILDRYFTARIGNIKLSELRPLHIQSCANGMADMSKSYIRKARITVADVMRKAKSNKLIADDIMAEIEWPKGSETERRALYDDERELFMAASKDHPNGLFFRIMYGCGLRNSEVRALQWGDVDLAEGTIHVSRAIKKSTGKPGPPKSKAGYRAVPIPPWLLSELKSAPRTALYVIPSETGSYVSTDRVKRAWGSLTNAMMLASGVPTYRNQLDKILAKQSSIAELSPYNLRHTYCTILAENDVPMKTAQYLMGHSSIEMTARIYTHVSIKILDNARSRIEAIWDENGNFGTPPGQIQRMTS